MTVWFRSSQKSALTCWRSQRAKEAAAAPLPLPAPSAWPGSPPVGPAAAPNFCSPWMSTRSPAPQPPCGSALQPSASEESGWSTEVLDSPPLGLGADLCRRRSSEATRLHHCELKTWAINNYVTSLNVLKIPLSVCLLGSFWVLWLLCNLS